MQTKSVTHACLDFAPGDCCYYNIKQRHHEPEIALSTLYKDTHYIHNSMKIHIVFSHSLTNDDRVAKHHYFFFLRAQI